MNEEEFSKKKTEVKLILDIPHKKTPKIMLDWASKATVICNKKKQKTLNKLKCDRLDQPIIPEKSCNNNLFCFKFNKKNDAIDSLILKIRIGFKINLTSTNHVA